MPHSAYLYTSIFIRYYTRMRILVLPGDGIGPEISEATLRVLHEVDRILDLGLVFDIRDIGLASLRDRGSTLPEEVVARVDGGVWAVSTDGRPDRGDGHACSCPAPVPLG